MGILKGRLCFHYAYYVHVQFRAAVQLRGLPPKPVLKSGHIPSITTSFGLKHAIDHARGHHTDLIICIIVLVNPISPRIVLDVAMAPRGTTGTRVRVQRSHPANQYQQYSPFFTILAKLEDSPTPVRRSSSVHNG